MLPPLPKGTRAGDLHYIHSTVSKQIQLFSLLFTIIAWANSRISFKNSLHKRRERLNLSSESVSGLSLSVVSLQKDSAFTNAVIHWGQADKSNSTTRLYVATHSHTHKCLEGLWLIWLPSFSHSHKRTRWGKTAQTNKKSKCRGASECRVLVRTKNDLWYCHFSLLRTTLTGYGAVHMQIIMTLFTADNLSQ